MSATIRNVTTKCLSCKSILYTTAKVDNQTGKAMKYIEIHKGKRLTSPVGYMANYCKKCALEMERQKSQTVVQSSPGPILEIGVGATDRSLKEMEE
jgi:hypothetical protein